MYITGNQGSCYGTSSYVNDDEDEDDEDDDDYDDDDDYEDGEDDESSADEGKKDTKTQTLNSAKNKA